MSEREFGYSETSSRSSIGPSWEQLDKRYYYGLMPIAPFIVRLVTYPSNLVKTRLQSAPTTYPYQNTFHAFRTIFAKQGVVGLYRGMGFNMIGMLQDPIYMTTMELTKRDLLKRHDRAGDHSFLSRICSSHASQASAISFVSGSIAAMLVLTIAVPVDVVTQRLMIQQHPDRYTHTSGKYTSSSHTHGIPAVAMRHIHTMSTPEMHTPSQPLIVRNGIKMAHDIYKAQGLSGLYRGLGTSMFLYVPFCGILWSTFAGSRVITDRMFHVIPPHLVTHPSQQTSEWRYMSSLTLSALIAGIAASAFTNPIDVLRTRLQVSTATQSPSLRSIYHSMIAEHGSAFRGLTSGLLARIMAGGPTNAILVSAYEIIKRVSTYKQQL